MHELSLALDLVDRATAIALREKASRVSRVTVVIGPESGVDSEAFAFAFPEAARNTPLEKATLSVVPGSGREFQFRSMEIIETGEVENV